MPYALPDLRSFLPKLLLGATVCAAPLLLTPASAEACGGTFCDAGPTVMPVDQTGESIVFWIDEGGSEPFTEAHIQIQYEGNDAERFAWIIPVTNVPDVLVGSQALFDNMLAATVPTFTTNSRTIGDCGGGGICFCCGDDAAGGRIDALSGGDWGTGEAGESDTSGPEILDRGIAGAFEYVTLTGDNIDEIVTWLDDNGYAQDDEAPPILQEYLDEGFVFTAVKLQSGAGVDEIHPLAIRYPGTEPCIPIRLTRIAAVEDMAIRAFFLGEQRVAPSNWPHVELNPSRFDWVNGPELNYNEVVSLAIDEAGGRAFITEFAGTDAVVSTSGIYSNQWNPAAYEGATPQEVVDTLSAQQLLVCSFGECSFRHLQVQPLLDKYLPVPEGVTADDFYDCVDCFADLIDQQAWEQLPGFAADFAERISIPGQHAVDMLEDSTALTRLFTLISPHEMIEDPLFHPTDLSETVDNNITATRVTDCDGGPTYYELPDGRIVAETDNGTMPELEDNPAAASIQQVPMSGPPQVETDNGGAIDAALDAYNKTRRVGPRGCSIGDIAPEGVLVTLGIFGIMFWQRRTD